MSLLSLDPRRSWEDHGQTALSALSRGLSLAAAPTFATLALLTILTGGGMGVMYTLMSLFHLSPWLKMMTRKH